MDEFTLIEKLLVPLASECEGSLNLSDDAAVLAIPEGFDLVVTKDAISEGVHFIGNEAAGMIAKKLLRSNLSDLAAMGAKPHAYFLALMLPAATESEWIEDFAAGLKADQSLFSIPLAGGDTITTRGSASFSITALGLVASGSALKRSTAKAGDLLYVSGTLGDSALGLHLLTAGDMSPLAQDDKEYLINRYHLPQPRLTLGQSLHGIATACIDISDGLLQDASHLCATSSLAADIYRNRLPLSPPAAEMIALDAKFWNAVTGGGDDYELLFTVAPDKADAVPEGCTCIGVMKEGSGITLLDENNQPLAIELSGFRHFS